MKKTNLLLIMSLIATFIFTSCDKKEELIDSKKEYSSKPVKEIISIQNKFDLSMQFVDKAEKYNKGNHFAFRDDCPVVSHSNSLGQFPNTITIDFGDGCQVNDSVEISGKILVTFYGFMNHTGDSLVTEYQNLTINGDELSGVCVIKNEGKDAEGYRNISKELRDGTINLATGENASFTYNRTVKYSINNTPFNTDDDEMIVSGYCSGTDFEGNTYDGNTLTELVMPIDCGCFVSGEQEFTVNDSDVYNVDFGEGECDYIATLTLPDGSTEEIEVCNH